MRLLFAIPHYFNHDFYCYLEDDLVIRGPLFFVKLRWFAAVSPAEVCCAAMAEFPWEGAPCPAHLR